MNGTAFGILFISSSTEIESAVSEIGGVLGFIFYYFPDRLIELFWEITCSTKAGEEGANTVRHTLGIHVDTVVPVF
ncbi:hypothetical protein GXB81_24795 [Paraburkholderia sp. Ac-20336]|uniref:hypothetical protein n=1 Tax=Paraburkholderia sp. Ac-20336 TaxID=2703886 RepID=UPI00197DAF2A|nr:hypothetical protein [Paraburkholderia sp. Ac-20336]MBN3806250.1 hypothetical protein [Paraburkholderia sp. Ac-20336]